MISKLVKVVEETNSKKHQLPRTINSANVCMILSVCLQTTHFCMQTFSCFSQNNEQLSLLKGISPQSNNNKPYDHEVQELQKFKHPRLAHMHTKYRDLSKSQSL